MEQLGEVLAGLQARERGMLAALQNEEWQTALSEGERFSADALAPQVSNLLLLHKLYFHDSI